MLTPTTKFRNLVHFVLFGLFIRQRTEMNFGALTNYSAKQNKTRTILEFHIISSPASATAEAEAEREGQNPDEDKHKERRH